MVGLYIEGEGILGNVVFSVDTYGHIVQLIQSCAEMSCAEMGCAESRVRLNRVITVITTCILI